MIQENTTICQSCGLPLSNDNFGSNTDSTINNNYCKFCYKDGDFILPELTMEQQIERLAKMAVQKFGTPKDAALQTARTLLSSLKRWK